MLGRKPLFPGRDYIHTLNLVCKVVGTPTPAEISRFPSEKAQHYLHSMPPQQPTQLQQLFPEADPRAIDLLSRLLTFDPHERITAVQALSHPYFTELHDPTDEPLVPAPLPSDPEIDIMPIVQVRDEVLKEMIQYNPDLEYM